MAGKDVSIVVKHESSSIDTCIELLMRKKINKVKVVFKTQ